MQVNPASTTVVWSNPAAIIYGTALGAAQMNATVTPVGATGTFVYTPGAGTVLNAGSQTLSVAFNPSSANYVGSTGSVTLQVNQASQTITFTVPPPPTATNKSSFTVAATASSGLSVSYSSSGSCTNIGATFTDHKRNRHLHRNGESSWKRKLLGCADRHRNYNSSQSDCANGELHRRSCQRFVSEHIYSGSNNERQHGSDHYSHGSLHH